MCSSLNACDDYLTPEASRVIDKNEVFSTYANFQGFQDVMYRSLTDFNSHALTTTMCMGGETYSTNGLSSANKSATGGYLNFLSGPSSPNGVLQSLFFCTGEKDPGQDNSGVWFSGQRGQRTANECITILTKTPELLKIATEEERNLLLGQAYFFRAFYNWEIISSFGGMPYIKEVVPLDDYKKYTRLSYQNSSKEIAKDLTIAASLLPEDWENTALGKASPGRNLGRATKGAALLLKAKVWLFAGSPRMNLESGGADEFNKPMMDSAASAATEFIQLFNKGVYSLTPMADFQKMFATTTGELPYTKETVFQKIKQVKGPGEYTVKLGRTFGPSRFGGNSVTETPNQVYVDKFEMADGTIYDKAYDADNTKRWNNRDPRFRASVYVDGDVHGTVAGKFEFFKGGVDANLGAEVATPYYVKKFWPVGVNNKDNAWGNFRYVTPKLRAAEAFLIYAEAMTEGRGATSVWPGANINAVEALNIVRARAGMPKVTAQAVGYNSFRDLVRNERWVELAFEGHLWFDTRRWNVAHLPVNKEVWTIDFDKDYTKFTRRKITDRVFEQKHYWMPLPNAQTLIFKGYQQNPGW